MRLLAALAAALLVAGCEDAPEAHKQIPRPKTPEFDPAQREAWRANDERVSALAGALRRRPLPGFSDIWIEHEGGYRVVVAFKGRADEAAVLERAHPELRPFIRFKAAERSRTEIERDLDRIIAVMRKAPGQWSGGYDPRTERFSINVTAPAAADHARARLPADIAEDSDIRVGGVPAPLAR